MIEENAYLRKNTLNNKELTGKDYPDPLGADSESLDASSVRVFCVRNSQREGRSLPREGRDHLFQWDVGISVGFSTGTTGSLYEYLYQVKGVKKMMPVLLCFLKIYNS